MVLTVIVLVTLQRTRSVSILALFVHKRTSIFTTNACHTTKSIDFYLISIQVRWIRKCQANDVPQGTKTFH
jgi:hypothetical protein